MTKSATTSECCHDDYHIMRHLFTEAMQSSITDKRWRIFATFSDPGRTMLTQYEHAESGDRIKCQSFDYEDGEYRKHIFTFDQDIDVNDNPPNAGDQGARPTDAGKAPGGDVPRSPASPCWADAQSAGETP